MRVLREGEAAKQICRYLTAGIMAQGVVMERHEGTPQGGPLSPLLANVLLDEADRELEKRGLSFIRYADDLTYFPHIGRWISPNYCEGWRAQVGALL